MSFNVELTEKKHKRLKTLLCKSETVAPDLLWPFVLDITNIAADQLLEIDVSLQLYV